MSLFPVAMRRIALAALTASLGMTGEAAEAQRADRSAPGLTAFGSDAELEDY